MALLPTGKDCLNQPNLSTVIHSNALTTINYTINCHVYPAPHPLHKDTPVIGPFTAKQNIHPIISPSPSPLNIRPPSPCIEMNSIYYDVLKLDQKTVNYKRYFVSRLHDRSSECSHCQQQSYSGPRSPGRSYSTYLWNDSGFKPFTKRILISTVIACFEATFLFHS